MKHFLWHLVINGDLWLLLVIFHDKTWRFIMINHDISWSIMTNHHPIGQYWAIGRRLQVTTEMVHDNVLSWSQILIRVGGGGLFYIPKMCPFQIRLIYRGAQNILPNPTEIMVLHISLYPILVGRNEKDQSNHHNHMMLCYSISDNCELISDSFLPWEGGKGTSARIPRSRRSIFNSPAML